MDVETLGCDVLERAERVAGPGHSGFLDYPGDPEIDQVGEVFVVEQDVRRLDVAVQQANLMGGMQCLGDLADDVHRTRGVERPVGQHRLQVTALDQAHVDVELTLDFAVVVNRNDVRVIQPRRGVGFPAESLLKFFIIGEVRG